MTYIPSPEISFSDSSSLDAFGRLRTSEAKIIFDSKMLFDKGPLFWSEKQVLGGISAFQQALACVDLTVTSNGDKVIRQTKQRFSYRSGQSMDIKATGVLSLGSVVTGATSKIGYFDGYDGIYFKLEDTVLKLVILKNSVETESVSQTSWNFDKMDGYGSSGITLDVTKLQIFSFDFQWLGAGRVRCYLGVAGNYIKVHEFNHANETDEVYMRNPNLPMRFELESTGGSRTLRQVCSSVALEGSESSVGIVRAVDRGVTPTASSAAFVTLLSVRLKPDYFGSTVVPLSFSIVSPSGTDCRFALILNPVIAGTDQASWIGLTNSAIEYDVSRNATNVVSDGYGSILKSGYILASNQSSGSNIVDLDFHLRIGANIDGVPDELVLAVQSLGGAGTFLGSITLNELA